MATYYLAKVNAWESSLPQPTVRYAPDSTTLVLLAAYVARCAQPAVWLAIEFSWQQPAREARFEVMGAHDPSARKSDVQAIMRAMALVRAFPRASNSRPPGSGLYPTRETFRSERNRVIADLRRLNTRPSPRLIADAMFLGKSRYYELLRQWPAEES